MDKEVEEAQPWVQSLYSGLVPDVALGLMWGYVNAKKKKEMQLIGQEFQLT